MTTLQEDLRGLYNFLVKFSKETVESNFPMPIKVSYDEDSRLLLFQQEGVSVYTEIPLYYGLNFDKLKDNEGYLLPDDYDILMSQLEKTIKSGDLLKDRVLVSPTEFGFDIYISESKFGFGFFSLTGPKLVMSVKFVSGTGKDFNKEVEEVFKIH